MFKISASYHPGLISKGENKLKLHHEVEMIELGLRELKLLSKDDFYDTKNINLSLHLARTPVTESEAVQKNFINFLKENLSNCRKIISIGIHLTGSRYEGIGKFGFSSHFESNKENEYRACRFIELLQTTLEKDIWIENANFYSGTPREVIESWQSVRKISELTSAKIIADLSHAYIDSSNVDLPVALIMGSIPWDSVIEIHLSGIIHKNGIYHDGHSEPVHEKVWELFNEYLKYYARDQSNTYVTIEHSDLDWLNRKDVYLNDFNKLSSLKKNQKKNSLIIKDTDSISYAKNYLKKIILRREKDLLNHCLSRELNFDQIFEEWLQYIDGTNKRIVFSIDEIPPCEKNFVVVGQNSLKEYIHLYKKCILD